jgi:hypothetical protein
MKYLLTDKANWNPSGDGVTVETLNPGTYDDEYLNGLSSRQDFIEIFAKQCKPPILIPIGRRKNGKQEEPVDGGLVDDEPTITGKINRTKRGKKRK